MFKTAALTRACCEFALFQFGLFGIIHVREQHESNSWGPYPSSGREMKFRRCLFTFSIKREIRYFHVVVVVLRKRQKSVMHVQSCCLAY